MQRINRVAQRRVFNIRLFAKSLLSKSKFASSVFQTFLRFRCSCTTDVLLWMSCYMMAVHLPPPLLRCILFTCTFRSLVSDRQRWKGRQMAHSAATSIVIPEDRMFSSAPQCEKRAVKWPTNKNMKVKINLLATNSIIFFVVYADDLLHPEKPSFHLALNPQKK